MKKYVSLLFVLVMVSLKAQIFSGQIFVKDNADIYLNQVYVTNLSTYRTVLSNYNGEFSIPANPGDMIRFTSIITERRDLQVDQTLLAGKKNFIELKQGYTLIPEVVIRFKPTGNLRTDVLALRNHNNQLTIAKIIGLPTPKGDGSSPQVPVASLAGGGLSLSVQSIYDILSGDKKKKQRLYEYEKMTKNITAIQNYFGDEYFTQLSIPKNLISNFLQFVYTSDNISPLVDVNNIERTKPYIEKYLPIYLKRLRNSHLAEVVK